MARSGLFGKKKRSNRKLFSHILRILTCHRLARSQMDLISCQHHDLVAKLSWAFPLATRGKSLDKVDEQLECSSSSIAWTLRSLSSNLLCSSFIQWNRFQRLETVSKCFNKPFSIREQWADLNKYISLCSALEWRFLLSFAVLESILCPNCALESFHAQPWMLTTQSWNENAWWMNKNVIENNDSA